LTIGNFYEGSIDHINIYYLIKDTTLNPFQFEYLNYQEERLSYLYCRSRWDKCNLTNIFLRLTLVTLV